MAVPRLTEKQIEAVRSNARKLRSASARDCTELLQTHYRLALRVIAMCEAEPVSVLEIAKKSQLSKIIVNQILIALKEGGYPFKITGNDIFQSAKVNWWNGPKYELELNSIPRSKQQLKQYTPSQLTDLANHLNCRLPIRANKTQTIEALLNYYSTDLASVQ